MNKICGILTAVVMALSAGDLLAADPIIHHFSLKNGMEVVVVENHKVPAVSHTLWYKVGAADDPSGSSGLAHYVEHMMFLGTKTVPKGEFDTRIEQRGGEKNAFTSRDYTGYYVKIAKEHLPLVMQLEADRMRNLAPKEEEFSREREVIIEERRQRTDNQPGAKLGERVDTAMYVNHPYGTPIIGWKQEMESLSRQNVLDFYRRWYHPNNSVLTVEGDVTAQEVKTLAEKYYGRIARGKLPERQWRAIPENVAAIEVSLQDESVKQPRWMRQYIAPSIGDGDKEAVVPLMLLAQLMGGGEASTLYQSLVVEQKLAVATDADYNGFERGPGEFSLSAIPAPGVSMETLAAAMDKEVAKMIAAPVDAAQLARAKTLFKADTVYSRDGLGKLAHILGELFMIGEDERYFTTWDQKVDAATAEQLQSAARSVLGSPYFVTGKLLLEEKKP